MFNEGLTPAIYNRDVRDAKPRRLYTATLAVEQAGASIMAFHACHATSGSEVRERLAARVPTGHLAAAVVREGIDVTDPTVVRLVPLATRERLHTTGDFGVSGRALADGGDLHIADRAEVGGASAAF